MKAIVLGAGLVGGPMAADLAQEPGFEVTVVDVDPTALEQLGAADERLNCVVQDLSDPADVSALVADFDIVLNAVPGFMGYKTLEAIISAGKNVVDIAFFEESPFDLDDAARRNDVVAIVDCGVAPGMCNLLAGHAVELLDTTHSIITYVGGLPAIRRWPYEFKAVFSPIDVIAEYTRPARFVENGQLVTRKALSESELIDFPGIGTLEAFNTDGLRTLATTLDVPNMKEKTLRYPGHIEKMAMLRDTGFFDETEIEIAGARIRPIDFTSRLLFPKWKMTEDDRDITVMQIIVEGTRDNRRLRYVYDLLDRYDERTGVHSMARTTGYTATTAIRLIAEGLYTQPGIAPPERLGREQACVDFMLAGLAARGVHYKESIEPLAEP
jgi:lysine 6-dehydrogenase